MGLGLSFGSSKEKSSTNSSLTKDETTNQQQSTSTQGTQTGSSSTNVGTNSSGTSTTNQTQGSTVTGAKTTDTTGQTSLFSSGILAGLENVFGNLLGNATNGRTNPAVANMGTFDPDAYVRSTTAAAASKEGGLLDATLGGIRDMIGGSLDNSSMGALLGQRATADSNDRLAGITGDALARAEALINQRAQTGLAGQAQDTSAMTALGNLLKGGVQVSTQTGTEGTTGGTTTTSAGNTATSESGSQNTQTNTMESIAQLVNALLSGSTHTTGTEVGSTTGSKGSSGFSLAL